MHDNDNTAYDFAPLAICSLLLNEPHFFDDEVPRFWTSCVEEGVLDDLSLRTTLTEDLLRTRFSDAVRGVLIYQMDMVNSNRAAMITPAQFWSEKKDEVVNGYNIRPDDFYDLRLISLKATQYLCNGRDVYLHVLKAIQEQREESSPEALETLLLDQESAVAADDMNLTIG